jgi:hypothetical protein
MPGLIPETPLGAALRVNPNPGSEIRSPGQIEHGIGASQEPTADLIYAQMAALPRNQFMAKWGMTPEEAQHRFGMPLRR